MPPTRTNEVRCKCKSYCTTWNPLSQIYEGSGQPIPRSTRDRHREEDRRRFESGQAIIPSLSSPAHQDWIVALQGHILEISALPLVFPGRPFLFLHDPCQSWPYSRATTPEELLFRNRSPCALKEGHKYNTACLDTEQELLNLHAIVSMFRAETGEEGQIALDMVADGLMRIDWEKEVQWGEQRLTPARGYHSYSTDMFFYSGPRVSATISATMLSVLVLHHVYFNTRRTARVHLASLRDILNTTAIPTQELATLPQDPRTITSKFRLQPILQHFISCARCHSLYPWTPELGPQHLSDLENVPLHCPNKATPGSTPCGEALWETLNPNAGDHRLIPRRKYAHQPLKAWLGRLLSRPDLEDLIESRPHAQHLQGAGYPIDDIWLSTCFLELRDEEGNTFYPGPGHEGRLVFSFACDSFDPFYVKTAKQSVSSTGIWMVLLNLPADLRYLHQNMYLAGVIPGPEKPSKDAINPYVNLVVEDLLEFWSPGVFLSRTHKYPLGKAYKAMLIPLVSDMLAARQVIGSSSAPTSHHLCTGCDLDKDDIHILDRTQWPSKSKEHVLWCAAKWRDAPSEQERDRLFSAYSVRWSPLFLLAYWDPVKYVVIDSMHTLDLNLFQTHCRQMFIINTTAPGGDGTVSTPLEPVTKRATSKEDIRLLKRCVVVLENPVSGSEMETMLLNMPRKVLYTICLDNNIFPGGRTSITGTKHVLVEGILTWLLSDEYPGSVRIAVPDQPVNEQDLQPEEPPHGESSQHLMKAVAKIIPGLIDPDRHNDEVYSDGTARIFDAILKHLDVQYEPVNLSNPGSKRALWDILIAKIATDPDAVDHLESIIPPPAVNHGRTVLGQDVMKMIWHDMKLSQIPTWVASAPPNWGTARRGKLSAAQWRVICTIHLPVTLISLWGLTSGRKKDLLDNFMHLTTAVRIANMRTSSVQQADSYEHHMRSYISGIGVLYPDEKLRPTHHAALHIGDFLRYMGPVHARSAPFFERYINFFHRINTNSHVGQLETTLLNASIISANVRALLADNHNVRPQVLDMMSTMQDIDTEDIRGFRLASILDPSTPEPTSDITGKPGKLTPEQLLLFQQYADRSAHVFHVSEDVMFYSQIALQGVCYGVVGTRTYRNSGVLFSNDGSIDHLAASAGIIQAIFSTPCACQNNHYLLLVLQLQPFTRSTSLDHDPYHRYGFAGGRLYLTSNTTQRIIQLSQIISHLVLTPMDRPPFSNLTHGLAVDRLMHIFTTFDADGDVDIH